MKNTKIYPHVFPEIEDWPIYKLSEDRAQFIKDIDDCTSERLMEKHKKDLENLIATTIYKERIRLKEEPWKVDPPNERQFWSKIRNTLIKKIPNLPEEEQKGARKELLQTIVHRYSEEIVGTFKIKTFLFARKFLTMFFGRLLNAAAGKKFGRIFGGKHQLYERLVVKGHIETIRALMKKGTVIVVPTHFSNLDSILIGYALDSIVGLPSFSYGAGLNLYNTGYTAYFMNRLGAYRLDRRKKNPIYLETLKAMSNLSIQRGTNSLFFPGGTRSRSGQMEKQLKLGLVGTATEAQRACLQKGEDNKIFIVPLILSYHFVLESKFLINNYLQKTGKEKFLQSKDQSYSLRSLTRFIWSLFSKTNEIILSIGQPLDVLGNEVNEEGRSFDKYGNEIHIEDYFKTDGKITTDLQREREYTRLLGEKLSHYFYTDNIVLTSHLVAFTAFNIFKKQNSDLDLFALLRLPTEDYYFPKDIMNRVLTQLLEQLKEMEITGKIKLSDEVRTWETEEIIKDGIERMGIYHDKKPLRFDKFNVMISDDFKILYYYHNRLMGYDLEQYIYLEKTYEMEVFAQ